MERETDGKPFMDCRKICGETGWGNKISEKLSCCRLYRLMG